MGSTLKSKSGRAILRNLKTRMSRIREKVDGVEVVAGFVKGKSSADSIFKAFLNEFGHTGPVFGKGEATTPPRPFIQQSVPFVSENVHFACAGFSMKGFSSFTKDVGQAMAAGIEDSIVSQDFEKLKDSTVRRKGGNDTILVETGDMYANITSEVRRAK